VPASAKSGRLRSAIGRWCIAWSASSRAFHPGHIGPTRTDLARVEAERMPSARPRSRVGPKTVLQPSRRG
jgi:hypothetical protein